MIPRGLAAVIDTNVWISGLLSRSGAPAQLTRQVVNSGSPVFSAETYAELQAASDLAKFDRYVTIEQRKALLAALDAVTLDRHSARWRPERSAAMLPTTSLSMRRLASETAWLVTGDKDLLVLSDAVSALGLHIVTPADALATIQFPVASIGKE